MIRYTIREYTPEGVEVNRPLKIRKGKSLTTIKARATALTSSKTNKLMVKIVHGGFWLIRENGRWSESSYQRFPGRQR